MVATDGGIFSFGDVPFYGSLPGLGINVNDVIGNAPIPYEHRATGSRAAPARSTRSGTRTRSGAIRRRVQPDRGDLLQPRRAGLPPRHRIRCHDPVRRRARRQPRRPGIRSSARTRRRCRSPSTTRIQVGYSYEQVVSLVAGPGVLISQSTFAGNVTRTYKWIGEGASGANANVTFRNDHAISKAQFGLT